MHTHMIINCAFTINGEFCLGNWLIHIVYRAKSSNLSTYYDQHYAAQGQHERA